MPASNSAGYIAQAIASILRQDDIDFELIVVDTGSQNYMVAVSLRPIRLYDPRENYG